MPLETKLWKIITGPFQLPENQIVVMPTGSVSVPEYTLDSLDLRLRDFEVRQKIKERWIEASKANPRLTPGLKFRLIDEPVRATDAHSAEVIRFKFGITDYGIFVATNSAARKDAEFAQYLMENGRVFYNDPHAYFSNPIGNCAVIESADGKIALIKRAETMHEYPGFYDTPGGHPEPKQHTFDTKGQFDAIKDEVSEEIGIPVESIEEARIIGVTTNLENFGKPDLLFHLKTGLKGDKMSVSEEVSAVEIMDKNELYAHFRNGTRNIVPPSQALLAAYYSLQAGYELDFLRNKK